MAAPTSDFAAGSSDVCEIFVTDIGCTDCGHTQIQFCGVLVAGFKRLYCGCGE